MTSLIVGWLFLLWASCEAVCPDIPKASKHYDLVVQPTIIPLPGGKVLQGLTYNGSNVGPLITAQLGEEITVDVRNDADVGTSVHWHGLALPNASWADGVAGVSQRPIPPGETFRYRVAAQPAGTHWYHAHVGMQEADGLHGPVIIQDPADPYKAEYDEEVVVLLTDQAEVPGEVQLQQLQKNGMPMSAACTTALGMDFSDAPLYTILTNGKGWVSDPATGRATGSPATFAVQRGRRYRFRVIHAGVSWALKLAVQGHMIQVIALDGANVARTPASAVVLTPGERVDFILTADQEPTNYWIHVATLTGRNSPALLAYTNAPVTPSAADPTGGLGEAPLDLGCAWGAPAPSTLDPKSTLLLPLPGSVPPPPPRERGSSAKRDRRLDLYLTFNPDPMAGSKVALLGPGVELHGMSPRVKGMKGCPPVPLIASTVGGGMDGMANTTDRTANMTNTTNRYCWGLNWVPFSQPGGEAAPTPLLFPGARTGPQTHIKHLARGAVVDLVLINPGMMVHPMHLHGQRFWVLGVGQGQILDGKGRVKYEMLNTKNPPMRDTQPVPQALMTGMGMGMGGSPPSSPAMGMSPGHGMPPSPAMDTSGGGMGMNMGGSPPPSPAMDMSGGGMGMNMGGSPPPSPAMDMSGGGMGMNVGGSPPPSPAMAMGHDGSSSTNSSSTTTTSSMVPGYAVIRFVASNPGVWAFHCHTALHMASGMFMAFVVPGWSLPADVAGCGANATAMAADLAPGGM